VAGVGVPAWTAETFRALGIGTWAHATLSSLRPELSLQVAERAPAKDGTTRLLLRALDGSLVETVIIPGPARVTLCISSQVGCARACAFCETGAHGLSRQLSTGEIVDQVRIARDLLAMQGDTPALSNVVFMGMGEPFDNLDAVMRATRLLSDARAFRLAQTKITVSTVGVADKLETFFQGAKAELAVSLNATTDAQRSAIMPINARFPLPALREAIMKALPRGRRVFFEYVVFEDFNDAAEDADRLAELTRGIRSRVNVIPANPGPDQRFRPPSPERLSAFVARLAEHRVRVLVRRPRGLDVGGACGQLAGARRVRAVSTPTSDA